MFTIRLKQTKKIIEMKEIANERNNVCFHSTSNKYPPVLNILNNNYTPVLLMVLWKQHYVPEIYE